MRHADDGNPDVQELLRAVDSLPCSYSRRAMRRALRSLVGRRLYLNRRDLVAPDELALAITLVGQMRIADARDALMTRLGCAKTKAYGLLTDALKARAGVVTQSQADAAGLRQLALALEDINARD